METEIKVIISDYSGVIQNDLPRVHNTTNETLEYLGAKRITLDQFKEQFDIPFEIFYRKMGVHEPMEEVQKVFGRFYETSRVPVRPFPGVAETLRFLKEQQKIAMIMASGNRPEYIKKETESYGIDKYFDMIKSGFPLKGKVMDETLKEFEVKPEEVLLVEDMECGLRDAKQRNINTLAIIGEGSYRKPDVLMARKPDFAATDFYCLKLFWNDFFT